MRSGASRAGGPLSTARVDALDPETLRLVQSFLDARTDGGAGEPRSAEAWDRFYAACAPLIRKVARRRPGLLPQGDEDRAQEVWLVLIIGIQTYDGGRGAFPGWLASVIRNALATRDRCERPLLHLDGEAERRLPSREANPPSLYDQSRARRAIEAAAVELRSEIADESWHVLHAHSFEDKSFAEIAAALGIPVKRVRDRHRRALCRLREILARSG